MRRSTRLQSQGFRKERKEEAAEFVTTYQNEDPPWLAVNEVSKDIGYGLFTKKDFAAGDCIVEYAGQICNEDEGHRKIDQTFLFYFKDGRKKLCIDASSSTRKGKFANDEWNQPNAYVAKHIIDGRPRLLVFAKRDISAGTEIRYDYGYKNAPWRKKELQGCISKEKLPEITVADTENEELEQDIPSTSVNCASDDDTDMEAEETELQGCISKEKLPEITVADTENEELEQDIPSTSVNCAADDDTDMEAEETELQGCISKEKLPEITVADTENEELEQDIPSTSVNCASDDDTDMEAEETELQGCISKEKLPEITVADTENEELEQDIPSTSVNCASDDDTDMEAEETELQGCISKEKLPEITVADTENEEDWWSEDSGKDSDYKPDFSEDETCSNISESQEDIVNNLQEDESWSKDSEREKNCATDVIVSPAFSKTTEKEKCSHPDNSVIEVQVTNNQDGKRAFDKKFPCFFCSTKTTQIQRHLRDQHSDEVEVQAITHESDSKEKAKKMTLLRNRGIHSHNCKVIREGKGILIVSYRPATPTSYEDYGLCDFCLGYYVRTDLWKHSCELRPNRSKKAHQERPAVSCKFLMPVRSNMSQGLHQLTSLMISDQVSRVAKSDPLILDLAERQYSTLGHDKDQHSIIRTKMRESARLLIELRGQTNNPNAAMMEFIHPRHFRAVVAAVQKVASYDEKTHQYGTPSLALKLGHTLKKMSLVCSGKASEKGDNEMYLQAQRFGELCTIDWSVFVSSNALRTLHENKRNRVKLLPLTEDVVALTNTLKEKGRKCAKVLEEYQLGDKTEEDKGDASESWRELNEVALSQIMLFNRRRQGEVSKMKVKDVEKIKEVQKDPSVMKCLSQLEQQLCSQLSRVEVVGKRGRTVPVLMNSEMKCWVELLMELRHEVAMVHPENEFVFSRSFYASKGHIRGSDCLRKYAYLCGAKNPSSLTGTNLRKQLATLCQLLNLKENEMDMIANYLGHDLRVHREYYRLPMEVLQVAKVSKVLIAMEKGGHSLCKGQNLDDLAVCDEELEESSEEQEDSAGEENVPLDTDDDVDDSNPNPEDAVKSICRPKKQSKVTKEAPSTCKKKNTKHRPWTSAEREAVKRHLNHMLVLNQLPGKKAIEDCISKEAALSNRSWRNVKDFCRNLLKSMKF